MFKKKVCLMVLIVILLIIAVIFIFIKRDANYDEYLSSEQSDDTDLSWTSDYTYKGSEASDKVEELGLPEDIASVLQDVIDTNGYTSISLISSPNHDSEVYSYEFQLDDTRWFIYEGDPAYALENKWHYLDEE